MADFTPQQLQAMQALIAGTYDQLDTTPKIQPGYSLSDIYGGMYPASGSSVASTFPARPEVPFSNTSRDRLQPNANPNIPGAGVAANDWYSQPGSYVNQMGAVAVNDLPPLKKPPIDITVRGGSTAAYAPWGALSRSLAYNALHPDPAPAADTSFPGASVRYANAVGPQMPQQPGVNEVAGTMKPGYQLGDGALAFATQNAKQPINGLSGLLASLFGGSGTAVGSKLDTRGPGPGELYKLANQAGQMKAILAPRTGTTAAGYVYKNGQQVGTTRAPGESAASQYDKAAAKARASSPDNGGNPSWW